MIDPRANVTHHAVKVIVIRWIVLIRLNVPIPKIVHRIPIRSDDTIDRPTPILQMAVHQRHQPGFRVGVHPPYSRL